VPTILGASQSCDYLHDYLHIGWANNPIEVLKLQLFLKDLEGYNNVNINGVFDQPTFDAVSQFQVQFQPDVLTPWGYSQGESTGYVYILTKKKINEIFCQKAYPLNAQQEQEIAQFRTFLEGLKSNNISVPGLTAVSTAGGNGLASASGSASAATSTATAGNILGISNQGNRTASGFLSDENLSNIAAAAFAGPQGWTESLQSVVVFFLILIIIYALSQMIVGNQNKNKPAGQVLSASAVRTRKALMFVVGLVAALILCLAFHYYIIILPILLLIIVAAATLLWFAIESKRETSPVTTATTVITSTAAKQGSPVKANPAQIPATAGQAKPKPEAPKTEPIVSAQPATKTEPIVSAQPTTKTEPIEPVPPLVTEAQLPEKDTVVEILNDK
jgi:Putative peptidoglycan binding domain